MSTDQINTDAAPRHGRSPAPFLPRRSEAEIEEAAKKYHGDTEKVPDTDVTSVSCNGVPLESRYGKARELEQMVHMVRTVGRYSVMIASIYCDSKAQATYQVRLSGGDEAAASSWHAVLTPKTRKPSVAWCCSPSCERAGGWRAP